MSRPGDFWARRKARVAAEEQAEAAAAEEARRLAEAEAAEEAARERSDEEILAELQLPDPDTLKQGDDFSAFMKEAVPDRIRRRALRRLWASNPVLANVDGLVDYGGDFTDSALVVENLQTAYQVGKGMLSHLLAQEQDLPEAPAEEETAGATAAAEDVEGDTQEQPEPAALAAAGDSPAQEAPQADAAPETASLAPMEEAPAGPRRRMRFTFENAG